MSLTSVRAKESCYFGKQDSISAHSFELAQTLNFKNHIDIFENYPFPEIELENEYDHEPQLGNSILFSDSLITPVSSPDSILFQSPHWILCLSIKKLNHQSL